jgi:hypothetical protein
MEIPYWGPTLANALDIFSGANPPGGQGPVGVFEISFASLTWAAIAATTPPALYNPPGSGTIARIMRVLFGDVSGTLIRANMRYYRGNSAVNIISGITDVTNTIQPRTKVASVLKVYSALTLTPAASLFMPVGFGSGGAIATQFYWLQDAPEGLIVIRPGEIWLPSVSNAALAMVGDLGIQWVETPLSLNN